ncbi:MAG: substrate-binding domain-containing protein [Streptosporangiales bacterium]|nr:substrate-binding domain-containing protein [Streptosporangiales bacterium]
MTTIRDVAGAAGVSPATVSRVLNQRVEVAADLRDRVNAAVQELGYRPNGPARSLRKRATTVLGIIIPDVQNPFFTAMVRGIEDTAQRAGYSVVLANTDEDQDKQQRYLEVAAAEQLAGVVLAPARQSNRGLEVLVGQGIPVVTVDRRLRDGPVDSVVVNNHKAAKDATKHLIDRGRRRIGIVAGLLSTTTGARRLAGYKAALKQAGIELDEELVAKADFRLEGGYQAAKQLLDRGRPDAVFASNNLMTIGTLQALAEAGVAIPDDVAVVGFDDISWATALRPPLTAVRQPTYEIGARAAELLLGRVAGDAAEPRHVVLSAELVVRGSS